MTESNRIANCLLKIYFIYFFKSIKIIENSSIFIILKKQHDNCNIVYHASHFLSFKLATSICDQQKVFYW